MNDDAAKTAGDAPTCRPESPRFVQRHMASALLPTLPPERLGEVTLMPHQRQGAARLLRIIARHGGALLADAVGLGKTFTALAVARPYAHVEVLAPAGLVPMWHAALARSERNDARVHSLHRASFRALPFLASPRSTDDTRSNQRTLVIIDEAHALRNPATTRYRHVAAAVSGCDVLLLTATPLHNRAADLRALVALFASDDAHARTISDLLIRREQAEAQQRRAARVPVVRRHPPITIPQRRETLDLIMGLPAPLPAREGAIAGALIRLGLLRAWCSSDAALTHALNRRLQRSSAMRDALDHGRHLSNQELRSWLIDDDVTSDMQLGFPELLATHTVEAHEQHAALRLLQHHGEALRTLRDQHVTYARADEVRAACLRAIREQHHDTPVVAFSQHARTVQALFRALSDIAGVGVLTGNQARVASGAVSRTELLGWFAPRAQGRPPPHESQRVTLLLTTDLIAEGVNLQDAAVVVHLDLPWTHAMRTQRTGRVARLGSSHTVVHEYRLRGTRPARRVLATERRVMIKARLSATLTGEQSTVSARLRQHARRSDVVHRQAWEQRLLAWATVASGGLVDDGVKTAMETAMATATETRMATPVAATVASANSTRSAVLLVRSRRGPRLLAMEWRSGRWRVSTRAMALLRVSSAIERGTVVPDAVPSAEQWRQLQRGVRCWWAHERARHLAGPHVEATEINARGCQEQQRARRWLHDVTSRLSVVQRTQQGNMLRAAQEVIGRASSAGARRALQRWMDSDDAHPAIDGWKVFPELVASSAARPAAARAPNAAAPVLEAALIVQPL